MEPWRLALLKSSPKAFVPMLAFGAFAGLRTAEIQRLEWPALDLAGGFIQIATEKAKTRSRRLVPLLPNLAQFLPPSSRQKGKVWQGTVGDLADARAETVPAVATRWKHNVSRLSFISYPLAQIQSAAQVTTPCDQTDHLHAEPDGGKRRSPTMIV